MSLQTDLAAAVALTQGNAAKVDQFVNGPAAGDDSLIDTEAGPVKTLARITAEAAAAAGAGVVPFSPPVAWATGLNCVVGPPATAVTFGGESYYCNTPHVAGATFAADAAKWTKFAAKGDPGTPASAVLTTKGDSFGHDGAAAVRHPAGADGAINLYLASATRGLEAVKALTGLIVGNTYLRNAADTANDIDFAAGGCMSDDGSVWIDLIACTKQLDAASADDDAGAASGMLDTGAVGNNDYWLFGIKNPATGACRHLGSLSRTAPTMPAGFTKKRLLGWVRRSGGIIVEFFTSELTGGGLFFEWKTPTLDVNASLGTSTRTDTIKVPVGISVRAHMAVATGGVGNYIIGQIWNPDAGPPGTYNIGTTANVGWYHGTDIWLHTSTNGQVSAACNYNSSQYYISTLGFELQRR